MEQKEEKFITSIIYISKDSKNACKFISEIDDILAGNFRSYEIICVNDEAPEETIIDIENLKLHPGCGNFVIIKMGGFHGIEKSMVAGVDLSIGDYVFEFESTEIDYTPEIILEAYQKLFDGYDIVSVVPCVSRSNISSRIFYYIFNKSSEFEEDLQSESFCVKSRKGINKSEEYSQVIPYRKAVDVACHLKRGYITYGSVKRKGISEWNTARLNTGIDAIILFTNLAFKISLFFSMLMAVIMLGFGIYVVAIYFGSYKQVEGWAPIMGVICLGFLGVFILLTNLFKHVELILRLQFRKKMYTVSSLCNIGGRRNE